VFILGLVLVAKRGGLVTVDQVVGISEARGEATLFTEGSLPAPSLSQKCYRVQRRLSNGSGSRKTHKTPPWHAAR
jgi:hypothetical protein